MHRSRGLVTSARIGVAVQLEIAVRPIFFSVFRGNPNLSGIVLDRTLPGQYQRAAAVDLIRHRPDIWVVVVVVLDSVAVALIVSRPVFIDRDSAPHFTVRQQVVMDNLVVDGVVDRVLQLQRKVAVTALHLPVNFVPFDLCVRVRAGLSIENKMFFYQLLHFFCCNLFVVDCIAEINVEGDLLLFQVVPVAAAFDGMEVVCGRSFRRDNSPVNLSLQSFHRTAAVLNLCRHLRGKLPKRILVRTVRCYLGQRFCCQTQLSHRLCGQGGPPAVICGFCVADIELQAHPTRKFLRTCRPPAEVVVVPPVDVLGQCFSFAFDRFNR